MTDRDTFAAAALTGLLDKSDAANPENIAAWWPEVACAAAYRWADAMLAVRDSRTADTTNHDAAPAAKAAKETLARGTDADGTGNTQGPVAWACFGPGYTHIAQHRELVEDSARVEGGYIAPLYRQPQPTLTHAEREAIERAIETLDGWQQTGGYHSAIDDDAATLRDLLKRCATSTREGNHE